MLENWTVSDTLGYTSITFWLGAQLPQVVENFRRESCEGLSLPFLANWLIGDISNLVGCILTNQLPFQATAYSVCIDCMLVGQYLYYYKPAKGPSTAVAHHIPSATSPAAGGRLTLNRGASRYRALSAVASNVAAAAFVAHHNERSDLRRSSTRRSRVAGGKRHGYEESLQRDGDATEEDEEVNIPSSMLGSFYSEGGQTIGRNRVSWSVEHPSTRAASVDPARSTTLHIMSDESVNHPTSSYEIQQASASHTDQAEQNAPLVSSTRGSRANRRGSTMVFLSIWALFGMGSFMRHSSYSSRPTEGTGLVLNAKVVEQSSPGQRASLSQPHFKRDAIDANLAALQSDLFVEDTSFRKETHEESSGEQVLGRIFAWLCTTLYLTSRLPQIWKNYVRQSVEGLSMYLFGFALLGNTFYVASILTSPRRFLPPPQDAEYLRESIPYLLGSAGTLTFDLTILTQSYLYRPRHRKHVALPRIPDEERTALLSEDALSPHPPSESVTANRGRAARSRSIA
ncbi:PQ loop repeat-domain-containing protein [Panaeolus papilionaceus]|nr:PQ loop repeat-domain-containing protein [Panaeolus papilionaceus]